MIARFILFLSHYQSYLFLTEKGIITQIVCKGTHKRRDNKIKLHLFAFIQLIIKGREILLLLPLIEFVAKPRCFFRSKALNVSSKLLNISSKPLNISSKLMNGDFY